MLIHEWMSKEVISIENTGSFHDAAKLFQTRIISTLPVLKNGGLVGIVTDGDIKRASPSDATSLDKFEITTLLDNIKMESIMSKPVITIRDNHTVAEAARKMLQQGISSLPVVDRNGKLVGILTKSDIFRCLVSFTGVSDDGQIFGLSIKNEPGLIKKLTDMIRKRGGRLGSVMTSSTDAGSGTRTVFVHAYGLDEDSYGLLSEEFRNMDHLIYCADLSRDIREIYR